MSYNSIRKHWQKFSLGIFKKHLTLPVPIYI